MPPSTRNWRSPNPHDLLGSLRRLYKATVMSANPSTLIALASFVSTDHILFGTDYPFMPESETADTIAGLAEFFGCPALANIEQQQRGRPRAEAGSDSRLPTFKSSFAPGWGYLPISMTSTHPGDPIGATRLALSLPQRRKGRRSSRTWTIGHA